MNKKPTKKPPASRKHPVSAEQLDEFADELSELSRNIKNSIGEMELNKVDSLFIDGLKTAKIHADAIRQFAKKLHGEAAYAKPEKTWKAAGKDLTEKRKIVRQEASDKNAGGSK